MSILSDKTIRKLCTRPLGIDRETKLPVYREDLPEGMYDAYNDEELSELLTDTLNSLHSLPDDWTPMIHPFERELVRKNASGENIISYGLSSYGYDVRLSPEKVKIFTNANGTVVDPMALDDSCLVDARIREEREGHPYFILPPNSYALGSTIEWFRIPRNAEVICVGKSTYARAGAIVNVTPIEPGFQGNVVIEISNASPLPIKIYLGTGIAQFLFIKGDVRCETSYADGNRKYQNQSGITLSKV